MNEQHDDLRAFLIELRRVLLLICDWIEKRYKLPPRKERGTGQ